MTGPAVLPSDLTVVVASANPKKAAEIHAILPAWHLIPRPADIPDVDETTGTFEGNARQKAEAICAATGEAALADDSGIVVDALDGEPGVDSAIYAGTHGDDEANLRKLLRELGDNPDRRARFRSVVVLSLPDGREFVASGSVEGTITEAPHGDGGFGYDPIFQPEEGDGRTFGEMSDAEKHAMSHRGRALRRLAELVGVPDADLPSSPHSDA